jgi:hypothetical protein
MTVAALVRLQLSRRHVQSDASLVVLPLAANLESGAPSCLDTFAHPAANEFAFGRC